MAKYQTKQIRIGFWGKGKVKRLVAQGWEVVHTQGGTLGSAQTITLRRERGAK